MDRLSPRRHEVARLFASGFGYKAIARQLHISPATVRNHLSAVYQELAISNKAELVGMADTNT
jgi:NarL family two-component system response regulator YdfI